MRLIFVIVTLILTDHLMGQRGINANFGTKSLSMGGISATLVENDAIFNNFANIVDSEHFGVIVSSERRFSLNELTSTSFGLHLPTQKIGHFGVNLSSYGFESYREQKMSLLYARKLHKRIAISANLDYNLLRISEHGSTQFISFGIGFSGHISSKLKYGLYIFTPEKIEIENNTEVPGYFKFGLSNIFSDKLTGYAEIEKVIDETINVKIGVDFSLLPQFKIYTGFNTNPGQISLGISYLMKNQLRIDGGFIYDTLLGVTPGVSILYSKN